MEETAGIDSKARPDGRIGLIRRIAAWLRRVAAAADNPDGLIAFFRSLR